MLIYQCVYHCEHILQQLEGRVCRFGQLRYSVWYLNVNKIKMCRFVLKQKRGWLYATWMNLYMSLFTDGCYLFSDGLLIVGYKNKMGTDGGGGGVDGVTLRRLQAILVPGWNPIFFFFANFCTNSYIRIHIIRTLLYKLYSTNSYNLYIFYTSCIVQIRTIRTFVIQIV